MRFFSSGHRDEKHFIEPGSFIFKAEAVDQYGNLIDRHNLWEMVGVRYRRAFPRLFRSDSIHVLMPGTVSTDEENLPNRQDFQFRVAGDQVTELQVSAKLLYRKIDQFLLNFLLGEDSGVTAPVTVVSEDQRTIKVVPTEVPEYVPARLSRRRRRLITTTFGVSSFIVIVSVTIWLVSQPDRPYIPGEEIGGVDG